MISVKLFRPGIALVCSALALSPGVGTAQEAAGIQAATAFFLKGKYAECLEITRGNNPGRDDFTALAALEIRTLLETGKYDEALNRGTALWRRAPYDAELALEFMNALRACGQRAQAGVVRDQALQFEPELPTAGNSRAAVAHAGLLLAAKLDAKAILTRVLEPAKKADPAGRAAYLAIGRLALANHDRELAAENFREGLKRFPGDPAFALGLEESGVPLPPAARDEENGVASYLDIALRANPDFSEALLYKAKQLGGAKNFQGARDALAKVITVNPWHPEAWAQLAALALLEEDTDAADKALATAGKAWPNNPRIPEIVGVALAAQYRFAEGIEYLTKAAALDPESPSIRFELGSNQLRFGRLDEGWENVAKAHETDPYHVAAFNLITLRDKLKGYPVREKDGVLLRMSPEDMAVFGGRALDLAAMAKTMLAEKYRIRLSQPVMVEMLPRQEDFAIRTFGLPGGEAFLGVCFGPLITMTSPRGRLGRANWEAVLWHEMTHTITLEASRHRIPRWLSEGISVHEEREARPGWGQGMTAEYRGRFLTGDFPPILRLDESFAGPDIQFGYYHSSLVAAFVIDRFGIAAMHGILADLAAGKPLEKSLTARTLPPPELDAAFQEHAKKTAGAYGPTLDWQPLTDDEYLGYRDDPAAWVAAHPLKYAAVMLRTSNLLDEGGWKEAKPLVETIIAAEPDNREESNPYSALAAACRGLGDLAGERAALKKLLEIDANASEAAARLLETGGSLPAAERLADADRLLETNPFQERAYRTLAAASKETGAREITRNSCLSLLALGPRDASRLHYELAVLSRESDRNEARLRVLKALEENPRFEAALEFLASLPPSP